MHPNKVQSFSYASLTWKRMLNARNTAEFQMRWIIHSGDYSFGMTIGLVQALCFGNTTRSVRIRYQNLFAMASGTRRKLWNGLVRIYFTNWVSIFFLSKQMHLGTYFISWFYCGFDFSVSLILQKQIMDVWEFVKGSYPNQNIIFYVSAFSKKDSSKISFSSN